MADGAFDPVTAALNIGSKVIDRLWPDPAQADAAKLELLKLQQSGELAIAVGQMDTNKIEAASASVWVSGWRPCVGWVCAGGCAWNWIGLPIAMFTAELVGKHLQLRPADLSEMMPLLFGMLGLGALRTVEKVKQVA